MLPDSRLLSECSRIDVSTSYEFTTPFLEAELDREILDELIVSDQQEQLRKMNLR